MTLTFHFDREFTDNQKAIIKAILAESKDGELFIPHTDLNQEDVALIASTHLNYKDGKMNGSVNMIQAWSAMEGKIRIIADLTSAWPVSAIIAALDYK